MVVHSTIDEDRVHVVVRTPEFDILEDLYTVLEPGMFYLGRSYDDWKKLGNGQHEIEPDAIA